MSQLVLSFEVALVLLQLTSPDGTQIDVNPAEIVSFRGPPADQEPQLLHENVRCTVRMADGSYYGVEETCSVIRDELTKLGIDRQDQ